MPEYKLLSQEEYDELTNIEKISYISLTKDTKGLKDESFFIRLAAYRISGFTAEALRDKDCLIRREAEAFFEMKERLEIKK